MSASHRHIAENGFNREGRTIRRHVEEEAQADDCLSQRGTRSRLRHRRTAKRMKPSIHDPSARQPSGEPSPVPGRAGTRTNRNGGADVAQVNRQIAELTDRSTRELRLAWRHSHRTGPPQGLSRDLLIRALANQLLEWIHGRASGALRRRLQTPSPESSTETARPSIPVSC